MEYAAKFMTFPVNYIAAIRIIWYNKTVRAFTWVFAVTIEP